MTVWQLRPVCVLLLYLASSLSQNAPAPQGELHPASPCPSVFEYENARTWNTRWYGVVRTGLPLREPFTLKIELDLEANQLESWSATVTSNDNKVFVLEHPGANTISEAQVRFFVNFQRGSTVPRLVSIWKNGKKICTGTGSDIDIGMAMIATRPPNRPVVSSITRPPNRPVVSSFTRPPTRPTVVHTATLQPSTPRSETCCAFADIGMAMIPTRPPNRPVVSSFTRPPTRPTVVHNTPTATYQRPTRPPTRPTVATTQKTDTLDFVNQCGQQAVTALTFIVNGEPTYHGEWPWHVAVYLSNPEPQYWCGGTLITPRAILTAAHCVAKDNSEEARDPGQYTVYLGKYKRSMSLSDEGVQQFTAKQIVIHPNYNRQRLTGDVAIILLHYEVTLSRVVRVVCVWKHENEIDGVIGKEGTVVGWGRNANNELAEDLMKATLPVRSYKECIRSNIDFFSRFLVPKTYCAGHRNGTSPCSGDSGGGMVLPVEGRWYIRGLVSNGVRKISNQVVCSLQDYTIFVDVAQYRDWLDDQLPELANICKECQQ